MLALVCGGSVLLLSEGEWKDTPTCDRTGIQGSMSDGGEANRDQRGPLWW